MRSPLVLSVAIIFILISVIACSDYEPLVPEPNVTQDERTVIDEYLNLPETPEDYQIFNAGVSDFNNNMIATIGRVLFYDKDLSADGTISCASCHHQELAFADNVSFSKGVHGNLTSRNSIAFASVASFNDEYGGTTGSEQEEGTPGLFWDERAPSIKVQMEQTFANPAEMGMDITRLEGIVKSKPYYQELFDKTQFLTLDNKIEGINTDNILVALESFVRSVRSTKSKFDLVVGNNDVIMIDEFESNWLGFTPAENHGKMLFAQKCGSCHGSSMINRGFSGDPNAPSVANNGLDKIYTDNGVGEISSLKSDEGKFKIPGLRNIELTAPYMHDGRFSTLEEVIDFYNEGIQDHQNLSSNLKNASGEPVKLNLTSDDKEDLILFLHTLTDQQMIRDSKWSDPFKK